MRNSGTQAVWERGEVLAIDGRRQREAAGGKYVGDGVSRRDWAQGLPADFTIGQKWYGPNRSRRY